VNPEPILIARDIELAVEGLSEGEVDLGLDTAGNVAVADWRAHAIDGDVELIVTDPATTIGINDQYQGSILFRRPGELGIFARSAAIQPGWW
jgi:hypothetical protein